MDIKRLNEWAEIVSDVAAARLEYPDAKTMPCTGGTDPMDLVVSFKFDSKGRPTVCDSALVAAAREGKPVILDNIDDLRVVSRLRVRRILKAAENGCRAISINGHPISFTKGFKVIAVTKKDYI